MSLEDIEAIRQLKARYFRYLDTKDWSAWRDLFTDDVAYYDDPTSVPTSAPPVRRGKKEFVGYIRSVLDDCVTVHQGHTPEIELIDDHAAKGTWALFVWVKDSNGRERLTYGHYHDHYEKGVDGMWKIKELRITRLHAEGQLPGSLAAEVHY